MGDKWKLKAMDEELTMLSASFWEELERIKELLDEIPEDEEREEDEEEAKYGDGAGIGEDLRKYQERLKIYAERLGEGLKAYGEWNESMNERRRRKIEAAEPAPKTPWERGHKLGCGCPGCTAYRDFYGIRLEMKREDAILPGTKAPDTKMQNYEEKASRPCGGRMYQYFHGERAGLKNVLGTYTKRFSFAGTGY